MKLVDDWRSVAVRSAANWVSSAIGAIVGTVGMYWMVLLGILPFMPMWVQLPLAIVVGVVVIGGPTALARIIEQPNMDTGNDE